jgi:hypothetical protein
MKRELDLGKIKKAKESKLIYLASPYSHPDDEVREDNYIVVSNIAAEMVSNGDVVFSPISYGHNLLEFKDMPSNWEFWFNFCVTFLLKCDKLVVCKMPGWENSIGVTEEIEIARNCGIEVEYIETDKYYNL